MISKKKYVVWRRNDGYVGASTGYLPQGWTDSLGNVNSFELLRETDDWNEAYKLIEAERAKKVVRD